MSIIKKFTDFMHGSPAHKEHHGSSDNPYAEHSDEHLIDLFHHHHKQLEHIGHHLKKRGHFIEIEYKSHLAARHGREGHGSTLFFDHAITSPKKISISKSAIAVKRAK